MSPSPRGLQESQDDHQLVARRRTTGPKPTLSYGAPVGFVSLSLAQGRRLEEMRYVCGEWMTCSDWKLSLKDKYGLEEE